MFSFSALESMEGQLQPAGSPLEELPQQINGLSLEKVQQYYRKLRYFTLLFSFKRHWKECSLLKTLKLMKKRSHSWWFPVQIGFLYKWGDPHFVRNLLIIFPQLSLFWGSALYRMKFPSNLTSELCAGLALYKKGFLEYFSTDRLNFCNQNASIRRQSLKSKTSIIVFSDVLY